MPPQNSDSVVTISVTGGAVARNAWDRERAAARAAASEAPQSRVRLRVVRTLPLGVSTLPGGAERPLRRGDCQGGERPCPWRSCRYHLEAEAASCALDVADGGPQDIEAIARLLDLSRQRIAQLIEAASRKLERSGELRGLAALAAEAQAERAELTYPADPGD
jgi:hypothetical protein